MVAGAASIENSMEAAEEGEWGGGGGKRGGG